MIMESRVSTMHDQQYPGYNKNLKKKSPYMQRISDQYLREKSVNGSKSINDLDFGITKRGL